MLVKVTMSAIFINTLKSQRAHWQQWKSKNNVHVLLKGTSAEKQFQLQSILNDAF